MKKNLDNFYDSLKSEFNDPELAVSASLHSNRVDGLVESLRIPIIKEIKPASTT